jgi:hypothetical protein
MRGDGRVVKASDSKSDGVTRTGSNPVRREFFTFGTFFYFSFNFFRLSLKSGIRRNRNGFF